MKKAITLIVLICIGGVITYNYIYQDHRDINSEQAEFSLSSAELSKEFSMAPVESEKKYLNKTIEVTGKITSQSKTNVTLDNMVFCQFSSPINFPLKNNAQVKIKGRFIGYDDLVEEIKLDQCINN
jgi:DNA replicative helicase MCM subunit Mcm2 (Cdc46/Mcm family)